MKRNFLKDVLFLRGETREVAVVNREDRMVYEKKKEKKKNWRIKCSYRGIKYKMEKIFIIHMYISFHLVPVMCVFILKFISCHKKVSSLRIIILEYNNNNSIQKSPSFPELLHSNIREHCKMETVMEWNHCLKYSYHEKHPRNDSL